MAVYDGKLAKDVYDGMSELYRPYADGIGIVCADGQPILTNHGLRPRTTQDYFRGVMVKGERLAYLDRHDATLVEAIGSEPAVWMVGTAFAFHRYQMLTAWHVVDDVLKEVDSDDATKLRVVVGYYRKTSNRSPFQYKVLRVSKAEHLVQGGQAIDIGLLTLMDAVDSEAVAPVQANVNHPRDGAAVTIIGHGFGQPLKHAEGKISDADPHNDRSSANVRITAAYGNSGSPIFWQGKLMGVFTSGSWPAELAARTDSTEWGYFSWDDDSQDPNGDCYEGTAVYIDDLL